MIGLMNRVLIALCVLAFGGPTAPSTDRIGGEGGVDAAAASGLDMGRCDGPSADGRVQAEMRVFDTGIRDARSEPGDDQIGSDIAHDVGVLETDGADGSPADARTGDAVSTLEN